jgi:hypothetical protein
VLYPAAEVAHYSDIALKLTTDANAWSALYTSTTPTLAAFEFRALVDTMSFDPTSPPPLVVVTAEIDAADVIPLAAIRALRGSWPPERNGYRNQALRGNRRPFFYCLSTAYEVNSDGLWRTPEDGEKLPTFDLGPFGAKRVERKPTPFHQLAAATNKLAQEAIV